ncbi:phage tail sheath subtilisin-like domain-containing protein [Zoogloea sp.]|uniref:phage tail sheath subtilisin-like domain-containing protein n=1 Tax=Zoogloea sp. TaxID=49181 RepID=UPI00262E4953|nr:phage tail sheath subtilisin-like domain-containing protein [Zoogloea sp.]
MINFNTIPAALRYPGVYVEVDGSKASLGADIPAVLLVGQKLAAGNAAAGEVVQISSVQDAINKAGAGSMLAQMVARYRAIDPTLDLYILPYADNAVGVAATSTITVTAAPTAAGTLSIYVAGKLVSVGITAGMAVAAVATAIAAAFTVADIPVTATANAAVVTLAARHKGTVGNDIDVRLNLYRESTPTGLAVTIVGMTGGSGNPAVGDLAAIIGQRWFRYVALGFADTATLTAFETESTRRYAPPVQQGFRAFMAFRGDSAAATAFGQARNGVHMCCLAIGTNPTCTWEAAAILAASAAPALYNNPVQSLEGRALTGLVGVSYFDWTQANSLLFKGMSVMTVARDGTCAIKRLVSMYQTKPDGSADDTWLDINTAEVMERIRYEQIRGAATRFTGTAVAKNNEGYRPGLRITTVDDVRAYLLTLYRETLMRNYGWVQAYDYYKSTLVVEQDTTNPSRINYRDTPVLLSPWYVLAGRGEFQKAV